MNSNDEKGMIEYGIGCKEKSIFIFSWDTISI